MPGYRPFPRRRCDETDAGLLRVLRGGGLRLSRRGLCLSPSILAARTSLRERLQRARRDGSCPFVTSSTRVAGRAVAVAIRLPEDAVTPEPAALFALHRPNVRAGARESTGRTSSVHGLLTFFCTGRASRTQEGHDHSPSPRLSARSYAFWRTLWSSGISQRQPARRNAATARKRSASPRGGREQNSDEAPQPTHVAS